MRDHGARLHAGCDLYAPQGTPVLACLDGKVIRGPYPFYDAVYAIEVQHGDGSIIRYGEIRAPQGTPGDHSVGDLVTEGQIVAFVGQLRTSAFSMLHFEMYSGSAEGSLTDLSRHGFFRRPDLINPGPFLDSCTLWTPPRT